MGPADVISSTARFRVRVIPWVLCSSVLAHLGNGELFPRDWYERESYAFKASAEER